MMGSGGSRTAKHDATYRFLDFLSDKDAREKAVADHYAAADAHKEQAAVNKASAEELKAQEAVYKDTLSRLEEARVAQLAKESELQQKQYQNSLDHNHNVISKTEAEDLLELARQKMDEAVKKMAEADSLLETAHQKNQDADKRISEVSVREQRIRDHARLLG